jgi:hypothetical protein
VEHFCCSVPDSFSELAHCWVLRGHLFMGVVLGAALGLAGLTHEVFVWWWCGGWGVVVC